MSSARDRFLQRVRQAVAEGNRAGAAVPIPDRDGVGYQGGGADPVGRFRAECTAAGGFVYVVPDAAAAAEQVLEIVKLSSARRVLLGLGAFLESLALADKLQDLECDVTSIKALGPNASRDPLFAADLGISGVDYLIAETGSVALSARPEEPRSLSLLPPVHIAVATRAQLIPDLFDLFEVELARGDAGLPSCTSLITGPSKTGDIELRLVTGVHGPGELHVVVVAQ